MRLAGAYFCRAPAHDFTVFGNYGYVAEGDAGFEILSLTNRFQPSFISAAQTSFPAEGICIYGDKALVISPTGLQLFDLSSESNPASLGEIETDGLLNAATIIYSSAESTNDVILDCDPGTDIDDVGDIAMMHALADQGEMRIVAEAFSTRAAYGAPIIEVLNRFYGRPDIPVGVSKNSVWNGFDSYGSYLQTNYYSTVGSSSNAPDAVMMYRDILAHRRDRSLTIIASGDMQNIHDLWSSPPDYISELSGEDLMTRKLKRLIVVAGSFPTGREYNFYVNSIRAAIFNSITNSLPVSFIGSEVGDNIMIGQNILEKPENDPVRDGFYQYYSLWGLSSRPAWTGPALLLATRGYEDNEVRFSTERKGASQLIRQPARIHG
jgi:hypothetical protein